MNTDAHIVSHVIYDPVTGKTISNRHYWEGGKVAAITGRCLADLGYKWVTPGQVVCLGGLRLLVIGWDAARDQYYVIQDGWLTKLYFWLHKGILEKLDIAYRRLIITAAIWRLVDYGEGSIPHWRQLHIAQKWAVLKKKVSEISP